MIKYQLACAAGHEFEAWFASSDAFDTQARRKLISCPDCASNAVTKRPMAPAIVSGRAQRKSAEIMSESAALPVTMAADPKAKALTDELRALKAKLLQSSEDVGSRFSEEARRIHFGEAEVRAIHGEATLEDARQLDDDGVPFGIFPRLPDDQN